MKKLIIITFLCCSIIGCNWIVKDKQEKVTNIQETAPSNNIFKIDAINDSLELFSDKIDSIPNTLGCPTLYLVFVEKTAEKDTTIAFWAMTSLVEQVALAPSASLTLYIKGACKINDKIYVVYYNGFTELNTIINEGILTLSENEYKVHRMQPHLREVPSYRYYKLMNRDSLILLRQHKCSYEK